MEGVVVRFGKRKIAKMGDSYIVAIPPAIARTLRDQGITEVEVVWVNDHIALYPVKKR
jgi:hypothetical protein